MSPPLLDTCPGCLRRCAPPRSVARAGISYVGAYCCPNCGHAWTTSWLITAVEPTEEVAA